MQTSAKDLGIITPVFCTFKFTQLFTGCGGGCGGGGGPPASGFQCNDDDPGSSITLLLLFIFAGT
jgi:hypothetical protein